MRWLASLLHEVYWLYKTRRHDRDCPICRGDFK